MCMFTRGLPITRTITVVAQAVTVVAHAPTASKPYAVSGDLIHCQRL